MFIFTNILRNTTFMKMRVYNLDNDKNKNNML